jgi:hypothetical protein
MDINIDVNFKDEPLVPKGCEGIPLRNLEKGNTFFDYAFGNRKSYEGSVR